MECSDEKAMAIRSGFSAHAQRVERERSNRPPVFRGDNALLQITTTRDLAWNRIFPIGRLGMSTAFFLKLAEAWVAV